MDPITSTTTDSIEEDIEEAISAAGTEDEGAEADDSSSLAGSSRKLSDHLKEKKRQLFEIDDPFNIDDEELSGGQLVQHFQPLDDGDRDKTLVEEQPSLTNQSTTNDVSELLDESHLTKEGEEEGNSEKDHSMEEIVESNQSVEMTFDERGLSPLNPSFDIDNESQVNKILGESVSLENQSSSSSIAGDDIEALKQRILSLKQSTKSSGPTLSRDISFEQTEEQGITVKQMERVSCEFAKDILEDITEESEKCSTSTGRGEHSPAEVEDENNFDSVISLNMIQMLEDRVKELTEIVAAKDLCMVALNMQLEAQNRRESSATIESGRESCSLMTNTSTEYRMYPDDCGYRASNFYEELIQRDLVIEKLTSSLQQSLQIRENLQLQSDKLAADVQLLRKQLTDAIDNVKKPHWPRDQECAGQRISEISMDLVSESDDDYDRNFLTDNEDRMSINSRDRQCSQPRAMDCVDLDAMDLMPVSKQIEQFQKYLAPDEVRIFFMIQKKFDDYLTQEVEKEKAKNEGEMKIVVDQMEAEKQEKDAEITRLRQLLTSVKNGSTELSQLRQELETIHAKEMEDLRHYFEKKCTEVEKQYSDEIFSHKSQRNDSGSEMSEQDNLPEESPISNRPKETTPKKKSRQELYASPSHRQITPNPDAEDESLNINLNDTIADELKQFYQEKIAEIHKHHDDVTKKLNYKLKHYETKYPDDDFLKNSQHANDEIADVTSSLIIIDEDEMINESQVIRKIIAEYEQRLQEQVTLAKDDILRELETQIQTLLSETTTDDHHWPPELILLREKFTAKSQLEIAQLQIKHEEEMARVKADFEIQLTRKSKRNSTFDSSRNLDHIVIERDGLRELCNTLRYLLSELAKCVTVCEEDMNATLLEEWQKFNEFQPNQTDLTLDGSFLNSSKRYAPDMSGLLSLLEDQKLVDFMSESSTEKEAFDLTDCLEKLKTEANYLLELSENLYKKRKMSESTAGSGAEKNDSCEEEDGLKSRSNRTPQKFIRASSLNETMLRDQKRHSGHQTVTSLPPDLNRLNGSIIEDFTSSGPVSELNFQVHELKNRLVKSEADRMQLQRELETTICKNSELGIELHCLKEQLDQLDSHREDYSEGYGLAMIKSPSRTKAAKQASSFSQLQERARNLLSTPTKTCNEDTTKLLQMIEDFCREGDKVVETGKKDREDLQLQIDAADKQLKATREFLEDQAADRELERDEFMKEIEKLKSSLRDREKERNSYENASKEVERLENQIKTLAQDTSENQAKKDKFEIELKASIDKIFVLREIISELETQIETKALNERVLNEKVEQLESYISNQNRSNVTLQQEVESLKTEIDHGYQEKIISLEDQLRNARPSAEQSMIIDQIVEQLHDIETTLDQKTKTLESLHQAVSSISCSTSPVEDVSVQTKPPILVSPPQGSPVHPSPRQHSLPIADVQRVFDKLAKHTRVEEAAIKRIRDLEMQVFDIRNSYAEIQHERDNLQERMTEQTSRITALQYKLEEQRHRAEELQRHGCADLNIRLHDQQNEIHELKEVLSSRDKQINQVRAHLEQSKVLIEKQEAELAGGQHLSDRSLVCKLEMELKAKNDENKKLRDKIKNEMINKLALPDLMETMLADKNEEIDHLKEQLESRVKEDGAGEAKLSARTLSDIVSISEYDEPDVIRRALLESQAPLQLPSDQGFPDRTMETSKEAFANLTEKRTAELSIFAKLNPVATFEHPHYFQDPTMAIGKNGSTITPSCVPRQINFSEFEDDSKKESTPRMTSFADLNEMKSLKSQIESLKLKFDDMENEKNTEIERLNVELREKVDLYKELVAEQKHLECQVAELNAELAQLKKLDAAMSLKDAKCKQLEDDLTANELKIANLQDEIQTKIREIEASAKNSQTIATENEELNKKLQTNDEKDSQIQILTSKLAELQTQLQGVENLRVELNSVRATLAEKVFMYEKLLLDHTSCQNDVKCYTDKLVEMTEQMRSLETRNSALAKEADRLRSQNSEIDDLAAQVERELNYSAQLDSNILKAIESEEENNFDVKPKTDSNCNKLIERDLLNQLEALRAQLQLEKETTDNLREELNSEKRHSQDIQEQDVAIIEAMRLRLEEALSQEQELHTQLDEEREKCERLIAQVSVLQRFEARKSSLTLKSPPESPRKSLRSGDFEAELSERLKSEIKLLTAQNERERERVSDLQRNLERERSRFETELNERIEYSEKLSREVDKIARDKDSAEQEVCHLQERLNCQSQEIESLEARIASLQEAESRRSNRRGRERVETIQNAYELQEFKSKVQALENERDHLNENVALLRGDIERGAQREIKLAEALANSGGEASIPQQFLQKMKEMNTLLAENSKENRNMAETVQFLVKERRQLQKRCEELENSTQANGNGTTVAELEDRAYHLLGRYLRVESHRKALVHQKRYLLIALQSYQDCEARAMALIGGGASNSVPRKRETKGLFKTAALAIIAIQRMKFTVKRWQTGKKIVSKSVFTITQQRRSQPNHQNITPAPISTSPPCRDTTNNPRHHQPFNLMDPPFVRPLQTPGLLNECAQKFDWSRLKK